MSRPRVLSAPGKWVLRAWHGLMIVSVVAALSKTQRPTSYTRHDGALWMGKGLENAHDTGVAFALLFITILWLVVAKVIKSVASAFARD